MLDLIELPETFSCMTGDWFFLQAGKLIANLIVLGSGVLLRAVSQAYRQAIVNASKSGVAQETVQNMAHKVSKTMTEHEARQILGVSEKASWEEVMKV
jgi:import inner membrane translocase subunit TIM16